MTFRTSATGCALALAIGCVVLTSCGSDGASSRIDDLEARIDELEAGAGAAMAGGFTGESSFRGCDAVSARTRGQGFGPRGDDSLVARIEELECTLEKAELRR